MTVGLFVAHGTNNLLNDYTDFNRGVDKDNYFRTQYGVHPLVQGFWTNRQQLTWFVVSGVLAVLAGIYALVYTQFNPDHDWPVRLRRPRAPCLHLSVQVLGPGRAGDLPDLGPDHDRGRVLCALRDTGTGTSYWPVFRTAWALPASMSGKHIDKRDDDLKKGVGTFPVRVGERAARLADQAAILLIYAVITYLVFVPRYFTPVMLIVLFAFQYALRALRLLSHRGRQQPPAGYPAWPTWFSAVTFVHNRQFGGLLILGLILDAVLHVVPVTADLIARYWPPV